MFKALGWLHAALLRLCLWLLSLPFKAVWSFVVAVLMLLGEEVRRWVGLAMSGLLILLAGRAALNYAPDGIQRPLVLTVLVLVCIWALAVRRAFHYTMHNNLRMVRQRMWFREVAGNVRNLRTEITERMARRAEGTAVGGAFRTNRAKTERVRQAAAERAAERTAAEAAAEAERTADDTRREELANLEPDPYTWENA